MQQLLPETMNDSVLSIYREDQQAGFITTWSKISFCLPETISIQHTLGSPPFSSLKSLKLSQEWTFSSSVFILTLSV